MTRFLLLILLLGGLLPARAQTIFERNSWREYQRYTEEFTDVDADFRELETVAAAPLFAALPFLKLRAGDRVVRGQRLYQPFGKGMKADAPKEWSRPSFFLRRGDEVANLHTGDDVLRFSLTLLPYFDWEPTRQNADAIYRAGRGSSEMTRAQLAALDVALQPEFAEYLGPQLSDFTGESKWAPGFFEEFGVGEDHTWVYVGLGYEDHQGGVYQYRLTLGARSWREERSTIIGMPPRPFFPYGRQQSGGPTFKELLAEMPADWQRRYQSQNARYQKFQQIVRGILHPAPNR